jgi:hypothetical protein
MKFAEFPVPAINTKTGGVAGCGAFRRLLGAKGKPLSHSSG